MPMNRALYPPDWDEISARLKEEVGQKCETCGVPNHALIIRRLDDPFIYLVIDTDEQWLETLYFEEHEWTEDAIEVVLTTAHLDHNPANNQRSNLKVLCQRCHLVYDSDHHQANRRKTLINRKHQAKLMAGQLLMFREAE